VPDREFGNSTVSLMYINEERLHVAHGLGQRHAEDLGGSVRSERTLDRAQTLQDANLVINTTTITHNEHLMKRGRVLMAQYGYFYAYTGFPECHNLQLMLAVTQGVERICPDAWILQAGSRVFEGTMLTGRETSVKVCGLCHGHYGVQQVARCLPFASIATSHRKCQVCASVTCASTLS